MAQKTYRTGKKGIVSFDSRTGATESLPIGRKKTIDRGKPIKKPSRPITLPIRKAPKGGAAAEGRTPKARKLTSLMRKGYRKGYRVKSTRGGSRR
jgi:hypothetical protein